MDPIGPIGPRDRDLERVYRVERMRDERREQEEQERRKRRRPPDEPPRDDEPPDDEQHAIDVRV